MTPVSCMYNRFLVPGFLLNSLPKSGTHLLEKVLTLFPGIRSANVHFDVTTAAQFQEPVGFQGVTVPIGVGSPQHVSLQSIRLSLQLVKRGQFASGHISFSQGLADLLTELKMKSLLILRDPRDVVVSHAMYVPKTPKNMLFKYYQPLTPAERLMTSIVGIAKNPDGPTLLNISERCRNVLPWTTQPFNYTTRFEKLVGPQGGGSREAQLDEIGNIARHLGFKHRRRDIELVAQQVFGGTSTFRKGTTGNWREHFTAEHKSAFKEVIGSLLIVLGYEKDNSW
jgi:hypothetical protein